MQLFNILPILPALLAATSLASPAPSPAAAEGTPIHASPVPNVSATSSDHAFGASNAKSPTPQANSWAMSTWSGFDCNSGNRVYWTTGGSGCTSVTNVGSVKVTNFGGCSTNIYTGSNCQGSSYHIDNQNQCVLFQAGFSIRSFQVTC